MRTAAVLLVLPLLACVSQKSEPAPKSGSTSESATAEPAEAAEAPEPAADEAAADPLAPPARKSDADRKSKNGRLEATIGGVPVIVQYGRPEVRGRDIFGDLIPYGKVWRTGADEATTLTVKEAATVEGEPLDAGTYALFTIPGEEAWTIIVNSQAEQWGAYDYDEAKDALRVEVTPATTEATEALTFSARDDALVMSWATTEVPIQIGARE